ncbi:hypothetical protein DFJ63DRAFT_338186 [Scheffersomyces coipomensis]|uniref:uncharacterized protein n=1 Tax=Scheffersomyces coipomensis TaxID=1788519 RepID=UPI00315D0FEC
MSDKLTTLKQLYSSSSPNTGKKGRSNDETYLKRLENDIRVIKGYMKEVIHATETVNKQIDHDSIDEKKRIIALYKAGGILPYIPSKDEVIPISTTSQKLSQRSKEYESILNNDKLHVTSQQVDKQKSNNQLFNSLIRATENIKNKSVNKITDLNEKVEQEEQFSTAKVDINVSKMEKESSEIQKAVNSHLKRAINKQIKLSTPYDLSESELKDSTRESYKLVTKLLNANPNSWTEIPASEDYESLLRLLILNNLVSIRDDSGPERYYVKIRDFGVI